MSYLHSYRSNFYPRPPGGGRRLQPQLVAVTPIVFLSTPSGWRATFWEKSETYIDTISIHALRVEGDTEVFGPVLGNVLFLSTPSGWRATITLDGYAAQCAISIHALRVEGDRRPYRFPTWPRKFLSTPSGWRATTTTRAKHLDTLA